MPKMKKLEFSNEEIENAVEVILMLYKWRLEAQDKERYFNTLIRVLKYRLETCPTE